MDEIFQALTNPYNINQSISSVDGCNYNYNPNTILLDRCIQHRGASLKTHARRINVKDLGSQPFLSFIVRFSVLSLPVFHRPFLCPFVACKVLFFAATSLRGSYFLITAH